MKKKLLIAEDEIDFSISLFNYIKSHNENIEIIGLSRDGEETIQNIANLKPDIILLDLQMPNKTGLDVIYYIQNKKMDDIDIIVISADIGLINQINIIKTNLIKYLFIKPFKMQDLNKIITFLSINHEKYINTEIEKVLRNFNFNISSKAYKYLIYCIEKSIENPHLLSNIDKLLYNDVARKVKVENKEQVKWGIQKIIKSMIRYTDTNTLKKFFPYCYKNVSPKIFIQNISNIVRKNNELDK